MKISYDLHLHSCLSPCGDQAMTPAMIAGIAAVSGLDVIALTDHNSSKNCEAFLKACDHYGILGIAGMELNTIEEVHVVCLFEHVKDALLFDEYVSSKLIKIRNDPMIFGKQLLCDEFDNVIGEEQNLLINATAISFDNLFELMQRYHGVMIPAHIDKNANSVLSNLGFLPEDSQFRCLELRHKENYDQLASIHSYMKECLVITNSDAHYVEHINNPINFLEVEEKSVKAIIKKLKGNN